MVKKKFYITTAIDYVNASPHIGHAFEKVLADALARWHKLNGENVFFLTGVDENAQKNVQAAQKAGVSVKEFINNNAKLFLKLCDDLNINYDKFIRTTAKEHSLVVQKFLKKMLANKDIYKGSYEGFYCSGCEAYITEKDLVDGKCPEHNREPEYIKQEAYFFKLSKYKKDLIKFIEGYVIPESKKKEILSRLNGELRDICITRKDAEWGIDFPEDKNYKIWVWIDALINYISGAEKKWPADLHVVGKGINWFHSVIWPAMLMSAKYKLPKNLLVHGYVTNADGKKMSKSLGNVISPLELIKKYGCDSVRYSLLKGSVFEDFDYSEEILINRHNNELANKLGNLVSRVSALIEKNGIQKCEIINKNQISQIKEMESEIKMAKNVELVGKLIPSKIPNKDNLTGRITLNVFEEGRVKIRNIIQASEVTNGSLYLNFLSKIIYFIINKKLNNFEIDKALNEIFAFIDLCNEYVQSKKPWETHDKKVLYELMIAIKDVAILLWPFIPYTSEKIAKQFGFEIDLKELKKPLNDKIKIKKSEILFKKIEEEKQEKINKSEKHEEIMGVANIVEFSDVRNAKKDRISEPLENQGKEEIDFQSWEKLELRVAEIKSVDEIEGADKLYKLKLDVGKLGERIVCAGLKEYYSKKELLGRKIIYFFNLKPRMMRGIESSGMILAAVSEDHKKVSLISPDKTMENGSRVS